MIVQCTDKLFYHKPSWHGVYEQRPWLIAFQDEQLMFSLKAENSKERMKKIAEAILDGWPVKIGKGSYNPLTVLPPTWTVQKGCCYELFIRGLLPPPNDSSAVTDQLPNDMLRFAVVAMFPTHQVWDMLNNGLCNTTLMTFIDEQERERAVCLRLRKQFPDFKSLQLHEVLEKYGERVSVWRYHSSSKSSFS